jgi:hypothetical protein
VVDLVSGGVLVNFNKHNLGVINVGFDPVSINECVSAAHFSISPWREGVSPDLGGLDCAG